MRAVLVVLVACGATPPSPTQEPVVVVTPDARPAPPVIAPPVCPDREACHHEAEEREADGDFAAAATAYGRACDMGDGGSCFAQAMTLRGRIDPRDDAGSHAAFGKACDLGIADGCAQAGTDLLTGVGVHEDSAGGRTLLERACTAGSGLSCYNLGVTARDGTLGAAKDPKAAYALFEQGCKSGMGAACTEQAIALHDGVGVVRDAKRAVVVADQACTASAAQCYFRAELHQEAKRHADARALYDKACGAGSARSCHNLGVMLAKGLGGAKNAARARQVLAQACALGVQDDCATR